MPKRLWCLLLLAFLSCSETKTNNNDDIFFAVDQSLLNPTYVDSSLEFSFSPPINWNALADSTFKKAKSSFEKNATQKDSLSLRLVQFFSDKDNLAFCSLTEVKHMALLQTLGSLADKYHGSLNSQFPGSEIRRGTFTSKGLPIVQFLIQLEDKVLFKLISILPNKKIVQLDYAIARSIYPNYIKHIESSIGSINTSF